ncbi:MAG TPA: sulfite exporter TauE/SafE family protein [Solirubrobacteraceae bacterium]|nr:sulfite exporter TauE/SafE family protein [Solirubrobacteraceae bacterium]
MLGISPEIILFGLGVGILIGLTGIGGGSLMTPLLIIVLGIHPVVAVGTDLTYGAITKTLGGYKHLRKGTVDLAVSKWLAYGGIPGALVGVLLVDRLHKAYGKSFDDILIGCIAGALIIVATVVLVRTLLLSHLASQERETYTFSRRAAIAAIALGFVLGMMLGMTSVGSGALIGVAMIVIFKLTPQRVAGSSVFLAAMLLWVAGLAQVVSGNVDYGLVGNILIGSMPGVWIGAHFVDRVPAQALRVTLGAVLLGSALAMVNNAGGTMPIGVIFGAPIAVGVLGYLLHLRSQRGATKTASGRPEVAAPALAGGPSSAPAIVTGKPGLALRKQP